MTDLTPAEELQTAAFQLRNPFHDPGLKVAIDPELAEPLADWLTAASEDTEGSHYANCIPTTCVRTAALAVARAINGGAS